MKTLLSGPKHMFGLFILLRDKRLPVMGEFINASGKMSGSALRTDSRSFLLAAAAPTTLAVTVERVLHNTGVAEVTGRLTLQLGLDFLKTLRGFRKRKKSREEERRRHWR